MAISRLLVLMEGSCAAQRVGYGLMLTTMRQSPFERLEALVLKLLERVVKVLKQHQSRKEVSDDTERAQSLRIRVVRCWSGLESFCSRYGFHCNPPALVYQLYARSYATKIESAWVATLFSCAYVDKLMAHRATVFLALLCNVLDEPQQMWLQMAQKAFAAGHQQLDLFAGK
ncbi:hypothetical protein PsorP6_011263 [Peronosclerospora sorghi]|uniref:Uncharacterized protein n=1 Tax=Peronosclerospora sorghi TaxID=230839 RepID=A0ACC0WLU5_9STRA|nr:hypothetical protein PsorP6_011263 [Peronosclerospora sorghi]